MDGLKAVVGGEGLAMRESRAAPGAGGARGPNVVLIVSDEHRREACGCYGTGVRTQAGGSPTPHLDGLAAAGVRFTGMYCASPLCAPSRAAYMTGVWPHTTTALYHKMQNREAGQTRYPGVRGDLRGMGEYFRAAGYRTAALGKMHVHGEEVDGWDMGFDVRGLRFYTEFPGHHYKDLRGGDLNRRYRELPPYADRCYREIDAERFARAPEGLRVRDNDLNEHYLETLVEHDEEMVDTLTTDVSIDFLRGCHARGERFFMHVGLEKPHRPWTVHQQYLDRFDPAEMPLPATVAAWQELGELPLVQRWCHSRLDGDAARRSTAAYYACVAAVDDCVGRIVAAVEELGIRDDTVIIYTSDHGENLYEHGLIEKHNMLEGAVAVPFIVSGPGHFTPGTACAAPCSLIDLLPTLCGLTGAEPDPRFEGDTLLRPLAGTEDPGRVVFSEFYQGGSNCWPEQYTPVRMALNRGFKYIYTHAALDQLYTRDPAAFDETVNLALDPAHEETLSRLRLAALSDWELDEYPHLPARARVAGGSVHLEWDAWPDAAGYEVYRCARPDPLAATRLVHGLQDCAWTDPEPGAGPLAWYWVVATPRLTRPFTDRNGKRRYGDLPVTAARHPKRLPVAPRLEVRLEEGFSREYRYRPLLGFGAFGAQWIYSGHRPAPDGAGLQGRGPCVVLTPEDIDAGVEVRARLAAPVGGTGPEAFLGLLCNYQTMDTWYRLQLGPGGEVLLERMRRGARSVLARTLLPDAADGGGCAVSLQSLAGELRASINGRELFRHADPDPLPPGRAGFGAGLLLPRYRIEALSVLAIPVTTPQNPANRG